MGVGVGMGVGVAFGLCVGTTMGVGPGPNDGSEGRERPLTAMAPNRIAPAKRGAQFFVLPATRPRTPMDATIAASPPRVTVPVVETSHEAGSAAPKRHRKSRTRLITGVPNTRKAIAPAAWTAMSCALKNRIGMSDPGAFGMIELTKTKLPGEDSTV